MPLELLVPMVVLGVATTLLITHALGGSTVPPLTDDEVRSVFAAEHPTLPIASVRFDRAGHTAVVFLDNGRVAVVRRLGDHPVVKIAASVQERGVDHLRLRFRDVGWPARDVYLRSDRSNDGV